MTTTTHQPVSRQRIYMRECATEILKAWRMPQFSVPTLVFPVAFYTVFGVVLTDMTGGREAGLYLLATYGVFGTMTTSLFAFGVGTAFERERGWLDLKRVSPMPAEAYILAKLATAIAFSMLILAMLYALGAFAAGVTLSMGRWAALAMVHLLTPLPFGLLGLAIAFRLGGQAAAATTNLVFMGLSLFGGLWMPLFFFPEPFQLLARALPSYHVGALALHAAGVAQAATPLVHLLALFGFVALFGWLAYKGWRRATE